MITLRIDGQIRGGKNNIVITRSGRRFPRPEWAKWRDATVLQLKIQKPGAWVGNMPMLFEIEYKAADKRRRDMPAIMDSLWHCLEGAGIVEDDCLLVGGTWVPVGYGEPGVTIRLEPVHNGN